MRRVWTIISIILIFGLFGCGTTNSTEENESVNPKVDAEQLEDFKVAIHVEEDLNVYATITYVGEEAEKEIYHGGSIFFFNVYQEDGNPVYESSMPLPLITTTLTQNEPLREDFNMIKDIEINSGTYEFEAIAMFSLDEDDVLGTSIDMTVSKMVEVE